MSIEKLQYRVYDNILKQYCDWDIYIIPNGKLFYKSVSGALVEYDNQTGRFTIERYTGLRDKNGKLIYEGDVVVQPNQYPYFDYADNVPHKSLNDTFGVIEHDAVPNYIGIVEWADESAQFVIVLGCVNPLKSGISNGICHCFGEDEELEVIGNIHDEQFREVTKMVENERG